MKKLKNEKSLPHQKTLFQSWSRPSSCTTTKTAVPSNSGIDCFRTIELVEDEEDDGLLAAAMDMERIHNNTASCNDSMITCRTQIENIPPGFDVEAGNVWIYPTNYPLRDYQFQIVEKALMMNTLVTLPTGLGKTFIAAVLMYNYYRWYPQGKIIFIAPTKPLVAQQIEACYNIMGIPESVTAELTGQYSLEYIFVHH